MPLSTEVFVMVIFLVGVPFVYVMLRGSDMRGREFFMLAFFFLTLSNIFTVAEEFWFNALFNMFEHLSITIGSAMMLVAMLKLTSKSKPGGTLSASDDSKV